MLSDAEEVEYLSLLESEAKDRQRNNTVWGLVHPESGLIKKITKQDGVWVETKEPADVFCSYRFERVITTVKRFVVLIGGRGSAKSVFIVDLSISRAKDHGDRTFFLREFQSSIKNSVHSLVKSQTKKLGYDNFEAQDNSIKKDGESIFEFAGIARNIDSIKSTHGFKIFSVEEAQFISEKSLTGLTPSLRKETSIGLPSKFKTELSADESYDDGAGEVSMFFVANPMSSADPFSKRFIEPYKHYLDRDGIYEDDLHLIIKINHDDNPWFDDSGLKAEMEWDYENKSAALADHIWKGSYLDTVDDAIIQPEWFVACIDAHKLPHLEKMFKPVGAVVASHDPSGKGADAKSYVLRHGSIIKKVKSKIDGDVDDGFDWALDCAKEDGADWFVWDGDGMGANKRQVSLALQGTKCQYHMFRGSLSGSGQDNADKVYLASDGEPHKETKTYAEEFKNNRAQYYFDLARRMENTYKCVVKGDYIDPDDMISFDSDGIESIQSLRSEICRIPRKRGVGVKQVMSKDDMKKIGIDSPNEADGVMMCTWLPPIDDGWSDLPQDNYSYA